MVRGKIEMKCNYCHKGKGRNYTRDRNGVVYYYYCAECVGNFKINPFKDELGGLV